MAKKIKTTIRVKDTFPPPKFLAYLLISTTFSKNDQKKIALKEGAPATDVCAWGNKH